MFEFMLCFLVAILVFFVFGVAVCLEKIETALRELCREVRVWRRDE